MHVEESGTTAGKVWNELNDQSAMSVSALKKALAGKDASVDWAIGWLAREDKLSFRKDKNALKLSLKK